MNKRSIKVAFLDHTAKLSGGELALARFLPALDQEVVDCLVVLGEDGPLADRLRSEGFKVVVVPLASSVSSVRKDTINTSALLKIKPAFTVLRYSIKLAILLRKERVDIVHTNSLKSAFYGLLAGKIAKKRVVWHIRDTIDASYLPIVAVRAIRVIASRYPAYVIANSDSTLESLKLPRLHHSEAIPSGIAITQSAVLDGLPLSEFSDPNLSVRDPNRHRICIVGRIARWKGQHIFIEAIHILKGRGYQLAGLIAGEPMFGSEDYLEELKQQVVEASIEQECEFLGFVKDVPGLLKTVSIVVHASISPEPFGQVIIEAMATGTPVIASAAGGPLEIIQSGETGILVTPGCPTQLADAIASLIDDSAMAKRIGDAGYAHVLNNFTIEQTAKRIQSIYVGLCS